MIIMYSTVAKLPMVKCLTYHCTNFTYSVNDTWLLNMNMYVNYDFGDYLCQ